MEPVIQATINALGYLENGVYHPEPDCFESIRDLIRFLRADTPLALARRVCGERNIVRCDLIPIMKSPATPDNLFDIALRLTINLCQPAALAFGGRKPEDNETWQAYHEIEKNLANSKAAFGDIELFKIFKKKVAVYFAKDWLNRQEEMKLVIERIIALVRYVLSIGDSDLDKERSMQDMNNSHHQLVLALLQSDFANLLIQIAANASERDFHLWILEIFAMMVKQYDANDVAELGANVRRAEETSRKMLEMQKIIEDGIEKEREKRRHLSSRHTAFAGSYVLKGVKAIGNENDLVINKVIKNCNNIDHLNKRKVQKRIPNNRRPFDTEAGKCCPTDCSVLVPLRSFCVEMLREAYSRLMSSCRDSAFSGRRTLGQNKADMHYFILMKFAMEFCRLADLSPGFVEATLSVEAFHHVQTHLDNYLESVRIERKEGRNYGLRAQFALSAYKELLLTLHFILKSDLEEWKKTVESICTHILKVEEYRDLSSCIIRRFMPGIFSKTFLRNVILANHAYISLVEKFAKKGMLYTVVKRRKIRKRRPRKNEKIKENENTEELTGPNWDLWEEISEELSDVIFGYVTPTADISAIDVLLNVEDEIHQQFAMLMVQQALRQRRIADAVGLYRSARDLWPLDGVFGTSDMPPEDEFLEMRAIYFVDLKEIELNWKKCRQKVYGAEEPDDDIEHNNALYEDERDDELEDEEAGDESDDSVGAEVCTVEKEIDFHFDDYILKFARTDVLKWYIFLLSDFETNSAEVNKAILKLLHRVAFDLKMAPRLYQLSLFNIFKRLGMRFRKCSMHEIKKTRCFEIYQFGYHLLRKFYADYKKHGSKLIPEILFWKGPKESYEIAHGYGTFEIKEDGNKGKEILWPEELDNELRALYEEYLLFEEKPEGVDIVEYVEQGLSRARTRRQIIRQMKMLGLNTFGLRATDPSRGPKSSVFVPEVVEQMLNLWEEYKSKSPSSRPDDLVDFIRNNLPEKYTRARIIKQLQYENIHYEPPPKKRRSKAQDKLLLEQREPNETEDLALFGDLTVLKPGNPFRFPEVEHERKEKRQNKTTKKKEERTESAERLSPGIIDDEMGSERSNSSISSVSIGSSLRKSEDDNKSSDSTGNSGVSGSRRSPRSSVKAAEDHLSTVRGSTNGKFFINDSSSDEEEELILEKRDRILPGPAIRSHNEGSAGDNDEVISVKRTQKKRKIVESDSE